MPAKDPRVKVPKEAGEEIRVSYAGDDPVVYTVENGQVTVKPEHLDAFLSAFEGASVVGGSPAANEPKE